MRNKFIMPLVALMMLSVGCADKEGENVLPGLYLAENLIPTFPTDSMNISGTASNYVGINSISIYSEGLSVDDKYDLSAQKPTVFNFDHLVVVPKDADVENSVLDVTVTDINGKTTSKQISFEFIPDTDAPTITPKLNDVINVDYSSETNKGEWNMELSLYDRRGLKNVNISIPEASINENLELSGMSYNLNKTYSFDNIGEYNVAIAVTDEVNNQTVVNTKLMVSIYEEEDPIDDYQQMFLVNSEEDPDNYICGYYIYMRRNAEYQYSCNFYAPKNETKLYIVPSETMEEDIFGVSPYVSTKLLNKKGYVKPIIISESGYYTLNIDIKNNSYSIRSYIIPEDVCTEDIWLSGTGFSSFADWGTTEKPMNRDNYVYKTTVSLASGYVGTKQYYFYTSGWSRMFRADENGYFWYENNAGGCPTFITDYSGNVDVTFDSALPFGYIKKSSTPTNE